MELEDLKTFEDIAKALDITTGYLHKLASDKEANLYNKIKIPKKNGEDYRIVFSPEKGLKKAQRKLLVLINNSQRVHKNAHGFVSNKNIITNASAHLGKKYILNIDIKDFFPSIGWARVYHMFNKYIKLPNNIATVLTNLTCIQKSEEFPNGMLPQGAPTSPIISNILCKSIDKELTKLAADSSGAKYTRYADDITFSCNSPFHADIVTQGERAEAPELGLELIDIITKYDFRINYTKLRLQQYDQHQEVTGITVNEKLNVNRKYVRKIRAILYSLENNSSDFSRVVDKFKEVENRQDARIENVFYKVRGMLSYLSMVKGKDDPVFLKYAKKYNNIVDNITDEELRESLQKILI